MKKTKRHRNVMSRKDAKGCSYIHFICRGCAYYNREQIWHSFLSSVLNVIDREIDDNSYLVFEEEFNNRYDPNAIKVLCCGEIFGLAGYIGREFTLKIKNILNNCNCYRIDMVDEGKVEKILC